MRTEKEVMDLIIRTAEDDGRIRAAYMNGSRTNPNAPKDGFMDYDVVYVVTETGPFIADPDWLRRFGSPLIIQEPDLNDNAMAGKLSASNDLHDFKKSYCWLMLFDDGVRIDLGIHALDDAVTEKSMRGFIGDKLTITLIDKDGILPKMPPPSDEDYRVKKPAADAFAACCNEFWWCLNNVAKGIARDELPYAMGMYNGPVRDMLNQMAEWRIGAMAGFNVSAGKMGKYFKKHLPADEYAQYAATYSGGDYGNLWKAVHMMCSLFHVLAIKVAERLGFTYGQGEEDGMRKYLSMVEGGII